MKVFRLLFLGTVSAAAINLVELETHKSSDSCWISVHGDVYDVTAFVPKHPGGRQIMLRQCGTIADKSFDAVHDSLPAVLKVAGDDVKQVGVFIGADSEEVKPSTRNRDFKMDETNLTPFAKTALHHVHNHPIVQKNAYAEWFAKGTATTAQVKDLVIQFSVFSSLFMLAQLQKTLNAPTLQEMREGKEILLNELGTVFKPVEGKARRDKQTGVGGIGDMEIDPNLVSTEGTVDGGTYYHRAAHFEWLLNVGTSLGIEYKDLGKRRHGTNSTLFFCDQLYNIYGSEDLSTSLGASFAIENWANAGFWDDLVDGFQAFNKKGTKTPMGFWLFHQALEGQHASHTMDELEEAIEGGRITDQAKFLKAADDILDAVAIFWNEMPGNWRPFNSRTSEF